LALENEIAVGSPVHSEREPASRCTGHVETRGPPTDYADPRNGAVTRLGRAPTQDAGRAACTLARVREAAVPRRVRPAGTVRGRVQHAPSSGRPLSRAIGRQAAVALPASR
jgi:hypothetical protein